MTVMLDANIWLSYLLAPVGETPINQVVESCLSNAITLVVPEELLEEITENAAEKSYLRKRIHRTEVQQLVRDLRLVALILPAVSAQQFEFEPDPDDEYLLTQAILSNTEYLVTGDSALLSLKEVGSLHIVSPSTFVRTLRTHSLL
jgi:putative PIN family toxin of toxin-antitoxin system